MKKRFVFVLLMSLLIAGCSTSTGAVETPPPLPSPTATEAILFPTEEAEPSSSGPVTLKVWLPPEFGPASGGLAGELLQARLDEFTNRRSNVRIEVRVKAVEGPGGMLDTLTTAAAAAPLALPDLVALPRPALESAAIKGLIRPLDGLTVSLDDPDWFEYARQLSHIQNSTFGIPFFGDAPILVYRPSLIGAAPEDWDASLAITQTLAFPAADPEGLVTLLYYQATGGSILDEEGRPALESLRLTEVLTYYHQASMSSLMPLWITQFETDSQAWQAFQGNQAQMVITWASRYLQNLPADASGAPIPTLDGLPFTLATGWAWAMASTDPSRQALSAQLAEFLTASDFLAEWSLAAGYLPPRPSSLAAWSNVPLQTSMGQVASSAVLIPPQDVLAILGPILQGATLDVLKEQADPVTAAEAATARLASP